MDKIHEQFDLFSKYEELCKKLQETKIQLEKRQEEFIKTSGQLAATNHLKTESTSREYTLLKKVNSLGTKLTKLFTNKSVNAEIELLQVREKLIEINTRINYWETETKEKALNSEKYVLANTEEVIKKLGTSIKEVFGFTDELRKIVNSLNETNWHFIRTALEKQIQEEKIAGGWGKLSGIRLYPLPLINESLIPVIRPVFPVLEAPATNGFMGL